MGGSSTTSQQATLPAWLETAAQNTLARADQVSRIPYAAYYGPDVAAMTPTQVAAMQGTNQMASAFGAPTADVTAGAPPATDYNGMSAYSSAPLYEAALAELQSRDPATYAALRAPFTSPATAYGTSGAGVSASAPAATAALSAAREYGAGADRGYSPAGGSGGKSTTSMDTYGSYMPGGVNTNNPNSLGNRMAASLSGPQSAPTAANRPVTRETASSSGGSGGMGGGKG